MRIFCGLAGDADGVAAAVVNERGGVIATSEVGDDPHGYLALCRMWVRQGELASVPLADDGSTEILRELAAAAGQPTTASVGTHTGNTKLDTAVQIGRALACGELVAALAGGTPETMRRLVCSLVTLAGGEFAAQGAFIELLRQCHSAAVSAWDDPTETACLEILRAVPDPGHAAKADPRRLANSLRETADPARVEELAVALAQVAGAREPGGGEGAAAIAAAAESVLSASRAVVELATVLDTHLTDQQQAAPPTAPPIPRPRRSDVKRQPPPQAKPTVPNRAPNTAPAHAEASTEPLSVPVGPSAHDEEPHEGGFPVMPEPPEFVDPFTSEEPVVSPQQQQAPPQQERRSAAQASGVSHTPLAPGQPPSAPRADQEPDLLSAPASQLPDSLDDADDDLLIFSQARSAWFKGPDAIDDTEEAWSFPADEGWRAAEAANANVEEAAETAETTGSGLPRRVPQANLVPGSAILSDARPVPAKRDANALASRTAGYFRGWSRARRETVGAGMGS